MVRPSRRTKYPLPLPEGQWEAGTDNGPDGIDYDTGPFVEEGGAVAVQEDGTPVVATSTAINAGHGLDAEDQGSGVAGISVDESELTHNSLGGLTTGDPHTQYVTVTEGGGDTIQAHGNLGATETLDPSDGNVHTGTLNDDCVVTLNAPTGGGYCGLIFRVAQDGTGGHTLTFAGSVIVNGSIDLTAGNASEIILETMDAGSNWVAWVVGGGSSVGSLDDLSDVTITAPAEGQALRYRSGFWVNEVPTSGRWELVVTGAAGPVPVTTDDTTDYIYAEV